MALVDFNEPTLIKRATHYRESSFLLLICFCLHGWIKLKNWYYMVVIPWIINSYYPVDIPHIKLHTQNVLTCI